MGSREGQELAFVRFENAPGEQSQLDWGHFGNERVYGEVDHPQEAKTASKLADLSKQKTTALRKSYVLGGIWRDERPHSVSNYC
jgi:hypothetical protein